MTHLLRHGESVINSIWENTVEIKNVGTNISCYHPRFGPISLIKSLGLARSFVIAVSEVWIAVTMVTTVANREITDQACL